MLPVSLALLSLLGACASTVPNAPSLMPRAIEGRSDAEPVRNSQPVAADTELDARIADRVAAIAAADRTFSLAADNVEPKVKRATRAPEGSDAWLEAQAALGELGQARSAADAALASLEELAIERGAAGMQAYPALDAAIASAQATNARQAERQDRIQAMLPS